jgi:hypothetical protein
MEKKNNRAAASPLPSTPIRASDNEMSNASHTYQTAVPLIQGDIHALYKKHFSYTMYSGLQYKETAHLEHTHHLPLCIGSKCPNTTTKRGFDALQVACFNDEVA